MLKGASLMSDIFGSGGLNAIHGFPFRGDVCDL